MIKTIEFKDQIYPLFQAEGHASRFAIPYAQQVCNGYGVDIGCMKREWAMPGSVAIDINFDDDWDAYKLPPGQPDFDYIFSSHCLEHLVDWVKAMDYWHTRLNNGGTLFLYLPDFSQEYWRPWNNYKHKQCFNGEEIEAYMIDKGYKNIFRSGVDLNSSFMIMGEKQ